jgi:hypothetical protein
VCAEDPNDLPGLIVPSARRAPSAPRMAGPLIVKDLKQYVDAVLDE